MLLMQLDDGTVSLFIPGNTFYQPNCIMDNLHSPNGNVEPGDKHISVATSEGEGQNLQNLNLGSLRLSPPVVIEVSKVTTVKAETVNNASPSDQPSPSPAAERPVDRPNNNQRGSSPAHSSAGHASPSSSPFTAIPQAKVSVI